jgi:hypothetical protein
MNDGGEFVHEQYPQLGLDFFLEEVAHEWDGIEGRRDLERLEGIVAEDDGNTLLLGEDENHEAGQLEIGECNL